MVCKVKGKRFREENIHRVKSMDLNKNGQSNGEKVSSSDGDRFFEVLHIGNEQLSNWWSTLQPIGVINFIGQLVGIDGYFISIETWQEDLQDHHTDELQHGYKLTGIIPNSHVLQAVTTETDDQGTQNNLR